METSDDIKSKYDVFDSFDALDHQKVGRLSMADFKILYLGLGFPKFGYEALPELVMAVQENLEDGVTLDTVMAVLSKFSRDRNKELRKDFSALDRRNCGSISLQDIADLSEEVEGKVLSNGDAEIMAKLAAGEMKVSKSAFISLFEPTEPPKNSIGVLGGPI